ncbi:MAG: hypothetical protein LBI96_00695 [Odoribacteraceae bacterium]|nr:hypothetical protein [Odoribacteraceae bacterium]
MLPDVEKLSLQLPPDITPALKKTLIERATILEFKKGDTIIDESFSNTKAYHILKGSCVRYIITSRGDEKAIMFHTEDFMPVLGNAYINSDHSIVSYLVKANEKTTIAALDLSLFFKWGITDAAYARFAGKNAIRYISIQNQFQNHLTGLASAEFLAWLMKRHPFIFHRFASKDIANFMGITPVWLSTLKSRLAKK